MIQDLPNSHGVERMARATKKLAGFRHVPPGTVYPSIRKLAALET
jgi:DNA-binding PadR family transcriptional regulator